MIVIHRDTGLAHPWPRAYTDNVDRRKRLSIRDERYAIGFEPPHYPVPATCVDGEYNSMTMLIYIFNTPNTVNDKNIFEELGEWGLLP